MIVIAHRGASGYKLENSMSAIKKAIELNVDWVEVDLQLTKDGKLVVFHDHYLERCTNSTGYLKNRNIDELIKKTSLNNGEKIPTLSELCKVLSEGEIKCLFELKNENTACQAYQEISSYLKDEKFAIGSFFHQQIMELKLQFKDATTCAMFESYPIDLASYLLKVNVDYVAIGFESTNAQMINEIKELGIKTFVWTVNESRDIKKAKEIGVDGIISNYPDKISTIG